MKKFFVIIMLMFSATYLFSEEKISSAEEKSLVSYNQPAEYNIWLNTGIGIGTNTVANESAAAVLGVTGVYKNIAATIRYALNSDEKSYCGHFSGVSCKESKRENFGLRAYQDEKSFILGVGGFNDFATFTFGTGISQVYRREKEEPGKKVEKRNTFGIPVEAQFNIKGCNYFSYGIYTFYNFNDVKTFGGFLFTLQIGYLK